MSARRLVAARALAAALLIGSGAFGAAIASAADLPDPTPAPRGGVSYWHVLASRCEAGSMSACDNLTTQTRLNTSELRWSTYNRYGVTCGGRIDYAPYSGQSCISQFPDHR